MAEQATENENQNKKASRGFLASLGRLSGTQKTMFAVGAIGVAAATMSLFYYANQPTYRVLYSHISEKDGGDITAALDQQQIPYKIKDNGSIMVPDNQVNNLRLKLASQGLPKGGSVGFELLENQKYGTSQFVEQVNYQRGLEGELSKTIQSIGAVNTARVHIAIPKQSLFVMSTDEKPTASIFLNLNPGKTLNPTQISGIIHLVSSSVPKLNYKDISIVDQNGALLSADDKNNTIGLSGSQIDYVKNVESKLMKNVENVLTPMFGKDNYKVQIAANVDFTNQEETEEIYKPNETPGSAAIRSKQSNENVNVNGKDGSGAGGVPGTLTNTPPEFPVAAPSSAGGKLTPPKNLPPVPGSSGATAGASGKLDAAGINGNIATSGGPVTATKNAVVNYEVDKKIRHVKKASGDILSLSASVVVNSKMKDKKGKEVVKDLTPEDVKKIESVVKNALGFNEKRGDTLSVVNASFVSEPPPVLEETPLWKDPDNISMLKEVGKYLLFFIVIMMLWKKLVTPVLKQIEDDKRREREFIEAAMKKKAASAEALGDFESEVEQHLEAYDIIIERAQALVTEDSKAAASLVKEWMGSNEK